uniref:MULE transposase domain-containing protein n=1 Tax=Lactuca sativa TaxID=4236 RepID=A0A9R1WE62_LACSA|nr:hypothetical protein LSAT_V11C200063420 [Lactuca sativa]
MCDRGGVPRGPMTSTKNTGSRKTNCPFEIFVCYYKSYDVWRLNVRNDEHNHEPAMYMEGHPYERRLTPNKSKMVEEMKINNVPSRDILSALKRQNSKHCYKFRMDETEVKCNLSSDFCIQKDIYLTIMQMIQPMPWKIYSLFTQRHWRYGVHFHRYNMPFLEIVGVTSTNTTFFIGFGFMDKEKESKYIWALNCLKAIINRYDSRCVIIALMNVCEKVFPSAIHILCRWHISQSIFTNYRECYKTNAEWNSFLRD